MKLSTRSRCHELNFANLLANNHDILWKEFKENICENVSILIP